MSNVLQDPLLSVRNPGGSIAAALLIDSRLFDVHAAAERFDVALRVAAGEHLGAQGLLADWAANQEPLAVLAQEIRGAKQSEPAWDLGLLEPGDERIASPVPRPEKMLFAGANYNRHLVEDAAKWDRGGMSSDFRGVQKGQAQPYLFIKLPLCVSGPYDPVIRPLGHTQLDYEVELAFVIGREGRHIPVDRALEHVAGYMLANDVSSRELTVREDWPFLKTDWFAGKNFETAAPLGPLLLPREAVPDWRELRLRLSVNGEQRQDGLAGEMTFGIEEQIAFASRFVTLRPGDVFATGTPAGAGFRDGRFLQPGDVVEATIDHLGMQRVTIVDENTHVADPGLAVTHA